MTKYLISFGHGYSKAGAYDSGCTYGNFTEQEMVRRLKPYLQKWAAAGNVDLSFYDNNMFADRNAGSYVGYNITEIHLDAAGTPGAGGHVIISSAFEPDDQDKRLAAFIKKHFETVAYVGPDGINERNDLLNLNVCASKGITYRLLELFFLANDVDRNYYINNLDAVAKGLIEALTGVAINGNTTATVAPVAAPVAAPTPAPAPVAAKPATGNWVRESGTFVPDFAINVRNHPNTSGAAIATYDRGQAVHYDSYMNDGRYVWIHYVSYSGADRYMVCRENGTAWGTFS